MPAFHSADGLDLAHCSTLAVGAYGADPGSLPFLLAVAGFAVVVATGAGLARRRGAAGAPA